MAKKTHQEKEAARMREVLRAQAVDRPAPEDPPDEGPSPAKTEAARKGGVPRVSPRHIKSDLIRSGILTAAALAIIALLYFLL